MYPLNLPLQVSNLYLIRIRILLLLTLLLTLLLLLLSFLLLTPFYLLKFSIAYEFDLGDDDTGVLCDVGADSEHPNKRYAEQAALKECKCSIGFKHPYTGCQREYLCRCCQLRETLHTG